MKTLRLLMPQWQGGYDESAFPGQIYPLGARLLAWLAPESDAVQVEVPVEAWGALSAPSGASAVSGPDSAVFSAPKEGGVFYRQALLRQVRAAKDILVSHAPDRVITFGGDCLISQAPFAYLNERYKGKLGVLWIDAHPDVTTPQDFDHAHAMVLGNLLGEGEPALAGEVALPLKPEQVALVGVDGLLAHERHSIDRLGLKVIPTKDIIGKSDAVTAWVRAQGFAHLAIHLDLDVLDPRFFRSLLFSNPHVQEHIEAERGKASMQDIARVLKDVASHFTVVGMSFAEHMPWDALHLKNMLDELPFMR